MDYWHFTDEGKDELIKRLTKELPALRGAAKASQDQIAKAIGVSRQTYNAVEMQKRKMSWNTYMSLILFFDYNPSTHYAGNRAGFVVYDFRDGQSREAFSSRSSIEQIANMDGVTSVILRGTDDTICAEQLMSSMEPGREYYMASGAHAAVVRLNNEGHYQYLELQSGIPSENGWHPLTLSTLYSRFGCEDGQSREYANYLIDLESLQNNTEFLDLLGYINTDEFAQMRGASGYVR